MRIVSRLCFLATITLALAGCDGGTPFDGETPLIVGTITSRAPDNGIPAMLVVEDGATSSDCYPHRGLFTLGPDVTVFHDGARKDTSELTVGRRVSVFGPIPVISPCLPRSAAQGVLVH